jgi:arylsulfatase
MGTADHSAREGYIYWMGPQMYGVKWHNFKLVLIAQMQEQDVPARLATCA